MERLGPTETTIWSTAKLVQQESDLQTIGSPLANTQILILDEQLQQMPMDQTGEIYISGEGLAKGYHA
jgi:enterobactin synthetase component F